MMPLYRSARRKLKGKETHYHAVASVRLACFLTLDKWNASMRPCLLSFLSPEPLALANTLGSHLTGAGAVLVMVVVSFRRADGQAAKQHHATCGYCSGVCERRRGSWLLNVESGR